MVFVCVFHRVNSVLSCSPVRSFMKADGWVVASLNFQWASREIPPVFVVCFQKRKKRVHHLTCRGARAIACMVHHAAPRETRVWVP